MTPFRQTSLGGAPVSKASPRSAADLVLPVGRRASKRCLDLLLVLLAIPLLLPLLALLSLAVRLESRGPAWFAHRRIGFQGKVFTMWKLRTMMVDGRDVLQHHLDKYPLARREWEQNQKLKNDPRITRLGTWLRRFSLDELPQFWNVLMGDMSLVGPRPIYDPAEVRRWGSNFSTYELARPGLTGLWQVSGRNDTTYEERIRLDSRYVLGWSLQQDLRILAATLSVVLSGKGAY